LLDTGSSLFWITSPFCTKQTCDNEQAVPYGIETSTLGTYINDVAVSPYETRPTATQKRQNATVVEVLYGKGFVRGPKALDRACLQGDSNLQNSVELCVPLVEIISVDAVSDLTSLSADGVLGLSPVGSSVLLAELWRDLQIMHMAFSFSLDQ
jgi:hypothetical protein